MLLEYKMSKLSTIKPEESVPLDEPSHNLLDEILPEPEEKAPAVRYPKLMMAMVLTLLFLILSSPIVKNFIVSLTPSFENKPYLTLAVVALMFMAGTFILLKSSYFNSPEEHK